MRGLRRYVPAAVAAVALAAPLAVGGPPVTALADTQPVEVLIESVTPSLPTDRDDLTVAGRIANTSDADIALPRVQLRLSPLQLNSRGEITAVLNGTTDRTGLPLPGTASDLGPTLSPGQQAQFSVSVPMADLGLDPGRAGVYAVFVEAMSGELPLIEAGTVIPWFPPDAKFRPTQLAWLWPIVQKPAIAADELVVDPSLPGEFTTGGRLGRLLDLGEQYPVSWLIDTSTWESARAMSDGYRVQGPGGPEPGDQTDAAAQFADRVKALMARTRTTTTQFAFADADALQRGGLTSYVVRAATLPTVIGDQISAGSDTTELFDAPSGTSDPATLETLTDSGVRELLLNERVFPPEPPISYTPSGVTAVTVGGTEVTGLLSDQMLGRTLARPLTTAADRSRAKQEFLAQTALITLELPNEPRSVIASPPPLWDPPQAWLKRLVAAIDKADWVDLVDLSQVAQATSVPRVDNGYSEADRRRELPQEYIGRIKNLDDQLDRLSRIVIDPAGYGESFSLAIQRAGSALWRPDDSGRMLFLDTIEQQIQEQKRKVRVVSSGTVTLAGDSGIVPLTIANDLDRPVSVGVQLSTTNPITLQYTPIDPVRIDAQEKAGVEVPVRVVGSQPMTVTIVLTDKEGRLYDDSAQIDLRSTASSRIATVVAVVGGVALVVLVSLNLFRRHRNTRARRQSQDASEGDSGEDAHV